MNTVHRAMLYLIRKKGKCVSLLLLLFVIATFMVSCFSILNATKQLTGDIRTSVGAAFYIRANTEVQANSNGEMEVRENNIKISQRQVEEILQNNNIEYYNPINYGFAKGKGIEFVPGDRHTEESNMGKITALRYSALASQFVDDELVITAGRHIKDADKSVIIISEQLAELNNISIGDTLTLIHAMPGERNGKYIDGISVKTAFVEVTVVGIYKLNIQNDEIKPTAGMTENGLYTSLDVLDELGESKTGVYTGEVDFYITDPAKLQEIVMNVRDIQSIDWKTHFIRTNDFKYLKIADRLSSMGNLIKILIISVSTGSILILTLILTLHIHSRMRETGIMLATGISKFSIICGFIIEVMVVTLTAMIFAYITYTRIIECIGDNLFSDIQTGIMRVDMLMGETTYDFNIKNYMSMGISHILIIYVCQVVVVILSTLASSIAIIRLKPMEILSKIC